jgi:hypothetical protein
MTCDLEAMPRYRHATAGLTGGCDDITAIGRELGTGPTASFSDTGMPGWMHVALAHGGGRPRLVFASTLAPVFGRIPW